MNGQSSSPGRRPSRRGLLRGIGLGLLAGGTLARASARRTAQPSFFVRSIQPESPTVEAGETFDVSGRIANLGTAGTRNVEYRVDEVTRRSDQITLDAAGETTVTFEGITTEELGAGTYTHGFYTDNTGTQGTLAIRNVAVFEVSGLTPRLGGANPGGTLEVTATVTNTGEGAGNQTVRLLLDGEEVDAAPVELSPGDSRDVSLSGTVPDREGEYTQAVETDDNRTTGAVSVAVSDDSGGTGIGTSPALLVALGGGGATLTLYGAYAYLGRRSEDGTDRPEPGAATDQRVSGASSGSSGGQAGTGHDAEGMPGVSARGTDTDGSTVVAAVIDENLEDCDTALSEAESATDRGNDDEALAACDRARTAATDARNAARSYDPDRLAEIESRLERVRHLEATIEGDSEA